MFLRQKYINLWYYKDKSTTLQIYPLRGKTTAKTEKFEKIRWIIMYVIGRILSSIFKISTFAMHNSYYFKRV